MNDISGKSVAFKLEVLYNKLATYDQVRKEIEALEYEIERVKDSCPHDEAYIIEEGTEFDGYDRNEYFCDIKCPDCGEKWTVYDNRDVRDKGYKILEGVTKLNVWRR
jgi:transposase-like protein